MGLYKENTPLFIASLVAICLVLFSMYLSFTTLNAYTLKKENIRLQFENDSLKQHSNENQMAKKVPQTLFMAL
jgi:hypothetical protein